MEIRLITIDIFCCKFRYFVETDEMVNSNFPYETDQVKQETFHITTIRAIAKQKQPI